MTKLLNTFRKNDNGATAIEYGLIAALIGIAIIAGAQAIGGGLNTKFQTVATTVGAAGAPAATP